MQAASVVACLPPPLPLRRHIRAHRSLLSSPVLSFPPTPPICALPTQDPMEVVNKYGADALRLYLINSPVVRCCTAGAGGRACRRQGRRAAPPRRPAGLLAWPASLPCVPRAVQCHRCPCCLPCLPTHPQVRAETLKFKEEGVFAVVKDVFLPWYNAYRWAFCEGCWACCEGCWACCGGWTGCCFGPGEKRQALPAAAASHPAPPRPAPPRRAQVHGPERAALGGGDGAAV